MKRYRCGTVPDFDRTSSTFGVIVLIVYIIVLENNIGGAICQNRAVFDAAKMQWRRQLMPQ